jgi:O-acetyl-ADP-ribose deacetylase (regulator of RNase III)
MQVILTSREDALADAWDRFCGDLPGVTVFRGSILDLTCDAVVSPANSFGFMDGGIDMLYTQYFGWDIQERLQKLIREAHHGELLVGAAEIVETGHARIPFLIAAPTMRVPMILQDTVNPYLAARAAFLLVKLQRFKSGLFQGDLVGSLVSAVAFPGLGTGVGRVDPNTCARQMRAAIEETLLETRSYPRTWAEAQSAHQQLYSDSVRDLQKD